MYAGAIVSVLMTPAELRRIGEQLYGQRWKSALARELGRHKTTLWRWSHGIEVIPAVVADRLRVLQAEADRRDAQ